MNKMDQMEDSAKLQVETANARLHEKTSEASQYKIENEMLKVGVTLSIIAVLNL
jgi:hypothetical protein